MRPRYTVLERVVPAKLYLMHVAPAVRITSTEKSERGVRPRRKGLSYEPRFKVTARDRHLRRDSRFVSSNDGIQYLSCTKG